MVEKVVEALRDSGKFSEVEVANVIGIAPSNQGTVYAFDDENGVSMTIKVRLVA